MTGVILVVDDVPANVKLLEAKLTNEYYDVITAKDGYEAIEQTQTHKPDLILLDVMMPGMDGFETCRKIKEDPEVAHIPIVMVTALSELSDRVQGLESGADDFITKPINDTALFARVKSLVRIKVLIDELRLRDQSGAQMGVINEIVQGGLDVSGAQIVMVDDDAVQCKRINEALSEEHHVKLFHDHMEALEEVKQNAPDLIMISTMLMDIDGLRLATQFKAIDSLRNVPIITLVDEDDTNIMLKALELGVNDYLVVPVDSSEMAARVRTQLRRKKYQDALKSNYQESVSMAITDGLTGLYNRHYLDTHLKNLAAASLENGKNMSLVIMDMDHFKHVNDTYGHDVGDEVLKQLAKIIIDATRSSDLVARFGGEEFVVLMPETDFQAAFDVADRIRASIEKTPFKVSHEIGELSKTMSIGVASLNLAGDAADALLKRADNALYVAKNGGRNQVQPITPPEDTASAAPPPAGALPVDAAPVAAPPTAPEPVAVTPPPMNTQATPSAPPAPTPPPQMHTTPVAPPPMNTQATPSAPPAPTPPPQMHTTPVAPPPASSALARPTDDAAVAHAQPSSTPPPMAPPPPPEPVTVTPPPMTTQATPSAPPAPTPHPIPIQPAGAPIPQPAASPPAPTSPPQIPSPAPAAPAGAPPAMPPPPPIQPAPPPQSQPLQPPQPAATPPQAAPQPLPPAAGGDASRVPLPAGFNPNLAAQAKPPAGPPGGLKPAKPVIKPVIRDNSYRSPIDDEPEGTF